MVTLVEAITLIIQDNPKPSFQIQKTPLNSFFNFNKAKSKKSNLKNHQLYLLINNLSITKLINHFKKPMSRRRQEKAGKKLREKAVYMWKEPEEVQLGKYIR